MVTAANLKSIMLKWLQNHATEVAPSELPEPAPDQKPVLRNYEQALTGGKATTQGLSIDVTRENLFEITGGWPKRQGDSLFVEGDGRQPCYLDSAAKLFGWMDEWCFIDWAKARDCVTQERFFNNLRMFSEKYDAVETTPHFPPLSAYYMHPELPESDGTRLEQFISFFSPATETDRDLIRSFVLTLFWGGPPGSRPAFLITGPENDSAPEKKGRGIGKSALVRFAAELVGGMITCSAHSDMEDIKKRLLSPQALQRRLVLLDNVKSLRFSWAELEGLITSPVISGHRMYHGEGRRANHLIWAITSNGATLSKDMAERCVIIQLKRPKYDPEWQPKVEKFIRQHRWEITSDIRKCLISY